MYTDDEMWDDYEERVESDLIAALTDAGEKVVRGWYSESTVKRHLPWYSGVGVYVRSGKPGGLFEAATMR